MKDHKLRSECPVHFALEIFGDRWSLLIVRDMIFAGKATYNEFLESKEKIATNILSSRLKMLEETGLIKKQHDPTRKTKTKYIYLLTPKGIDLIPLFYEIMLWSEDHRPPIDGPHRHIIEKARRNKRQAIDELRESVKARVRAQQAGKSAKLTTN